MRIGIPAERKSGEGRVAATPGLVGALTKAGHEVLVEHGAGVEAGHPDDAYTAAGAALAHQKDVWGDSELVVKVKEPVEDEHHLLRPELTLFCYLHLAATPALARVLVAQRVTSIGFETVTDLGGQLPLLRPMSEIAGRLSAQWGAHLLQRGSGGMGKLPGGLAGVPRARALIIGGGSVGQQAAAVAQGMGFHVSIAERSVQRLRELEWMLPDPFDGFLSISDDVGARAVEADVVIGAVLVPGYAAPRILDEHVVTQMRAGSVICDVAIDQGGCVATSRPTTQEKPTYVHRGVVHQCITNLPAAVPADATRALSNAIAPYVLHLARAGLDAARAQDPGLAVGVNTRDGHVLHPGVAEALDQTRSMASIAGS
jgi:alanine dehydrogenase